MSRIVRLASALLQTVENRPQPSGHMYAAVMSEYHLDDYQLALRILTAQQLVTVSDSHLVEITDTGRALLNEARTEPVPA